MELSSRTRTALSGRGERSLCSLYKYRLLITPSPPSRRGCVSRASIKNIDFGLRQKIGEGTVGFGVNRGKNKRHIQGYRFWAQTTAFPGRYNPSIYLSMFSHSVLPVDSRYRMWSRSVTPRCLSNSARAYRLVSDRVVGSGIRLVARTIVRYRDNARDLMRK